MSTLNLSLFQTALHWENRAANLEHFTRLIEGQTEQTDLMILPEMFTTGFSMQPEIFADTETGETLNWLKYQAQKYHTTITGSAMTKDNGKYYNRLYIVHADGTYQTCDKHHLFRMGEEQKHYTAGKSRLLVHYKGWRIFPIVCYDLRFPVWLRRTEAFNYDLMVVVANWPQRRAEHWKTLLRARAIENQCYVAAVNRVGDDGNGVYHSGDSSLISPKGEILFQESDKEGVKTFQLDLQEVIQYRQEFPVGADTDLFELKF